MISDLEQFYNIIYISIDKCKNSGNPDIAQDLENALALGSSALEILGEIRLIYKKNDDILKRQIGTGSYYDIIRFVNKLWG